MKLKLFSLTATMESLGVPLESRPEALSISLARAMGYKLPIPAEPADSAVRYFEEHYRENLDRTLAEINERCVFNLNEVSNAVAAIWLFRYRMVHDPMNIAVRDFADVMAKVGGDCFPGNVSDFMIRASDDRLVDKVARAVDDSLVPPEVTADDAAADEPTPAEMAEVAEAIQASTAEQSEASEADDTQVVATEGFFGKLKMFNAEKDLEYQIKDSKLKAAYLSGELIPELKTTIEKEQDAEKRSKYETWLHDAESELTRVNDHVDALNIQLRTLRAKPGESAAQDDAGEGEQPAKED